jgi:hypothetical protein
MPKWPYRQDDRAWATKVMWSRDTVIEVHRRYNNASPAEASKLLRLFHDGNTIGNEGCLLTCLAMVLRLLAPKGQHWTPKTLNRFAQKHHYYTPAGLAMATLYADIVSEASKGKVQLLLKGDYLPGERGWSRTYASTCLPLRAYRTLAKEVRKEARLEIAVMLKTGTYDDTVASHFVLVDPKNPGRPDDNNVPVLDPAQPLSSKRRPWRLSDSARHIRCEPDIDKEWRKHRIGYLQLGGVWVFARSSHRKPLGRDFIAALSVIGGDDITPTANRRRSRRK